MIIAALLLAIVPQSDALTQQVDAIELNHFYDDQGRPVFTQLLFWEWTNGERHLLDWRLQKTAIQPRRTADGWRLRFVDGEDVREIDTPNEPRESYSQHDPELLERERLPKELRAGLIGRAKKGLTGRAE